MSTVFRVFKTERFTTISNYHLFDKRLTHKATNLLTTMLALSPVWDYTLEGLTTLKKDGIDSIRTGINELEKYGYLTRRQLRNEKGQMSHNEYLVYETPELNPDFNHDDTPDNSEPKSCKPTKKRQSAPSLENPTTAELSPSLDFPVTDNPTQSNTKLIKNNYIKSINQDNINNNINNNTYRCDDLDSIDKIDKKILKEKIKKQISYEKLVGETDRNQTDSIVEILSDVMSSRKKQIRIAKEDKPIDDVRERLSKLGYEHICYVIKSVSSQASKPRNIKAYLLTALYNAPATMAFSSSGSDGKARERPEKQYSFDLKDIKSLVNNFSDTEDENPTANSKSCSTLP